MVGTYEKKDKGDTYKEFKKGDSDEVFKNCLVNIRNCFIKKYDDWKQKIYTRTGLLKPKSLSVDTMSFRFKIINKYLTSFPSPDNKLFSQSEMIEIELCMIPAVWVYSMTTTGLEPREKSYKDLIDHMEKLEVSL